MTISRKSKKTSSRKEKRPILNLDNDLLGFVNALEELDVPEEEGDNFETFADLAETEEKAKKPKIKKQKNKISLASAGDADFDDFTAVLDGDDTSFAGLKKRMAILNGGEESEDGGENKRKKKSRVKVVEAPLPTVQQKQIDRSVAYDKTVKDVSKWAGIIQKNRDAEQLKFPLINQQASTNVSSNTMVSTFKPSTDLEMEISGLIQRDGVSAVPSPEDTSSELPTNHLDPDQLYQELSKIRSSKFFAEIKQRRQAKIKSKKYRKILAKERMKAEAEAIASGNLSELGKLGLLSGTAEDSEIRRERRMKAEMDRARERLTLRTRKVNKWAQDLLNKRHGDADGRLRVLEQVREKERLRQEIYGVDDKFSGEEDEESEVSDDENDENVDDVDAADVDVDADSDYEETVDDFEVQEIFDRVKKENTIVTGRFKFNGTEDENLVKGSDDDEDLEEEIERSIVKKTEKKNKKTVEIKVKDDFIENDEENSSKWQIQKNLIREAFAEDEVFADFAEEKEAIVDAEAPKTIEVTLPGWGVWAGAGISAEDSMPKKKFVIHKKGLDPRARLDKDLKHVIINERRIKAAAKAFTIPKTPFPFTSSDMHARHIAQPIGKEWNTVTSHKKRIQPKIVAKAGIIIKPIKFFKQTKHV